MRKSHFRKYPVGSPSYVIAHAEWRASKGKKNPSAALTRLNATANRRKSDNPRTALLNSKVICGHLPIFRLEGHDTFDNERYPIRGEHIGLDAALRAAKRRCRSVERRQPSASSGGPNGIQDLTFIIHPNGALQEVRL